MEFQGARPLQDWNRFPDAHHAAQKNAPKSSEELVEVHSGSGQDGIDRIAGNALQPVALQSVFVFQMSDAWFDYGAACHPSPQCLRSPSSSSLVDVHGGRSVIVVAAIAQVHMYLANSVADQVINLLHLLGQRVAIVGISRETLGADEPSPRLLTATPTLLPNSYCLPCLWRCTALQVHARLERVS
jgi:hypothetical protein